MDELVYQSLRRRASQAMLTERGKTSLQLQLGRMSEEGVPELALIPIEEAIFQMKKATGRLKKDCAALVVGESVHEFVDATPGLSTAVYVFLGCLPHMVKFQGPSHVWSYCGLHVLPSGRAPSGSDLSKLKSEFPDKGWSPRLRAYAIVRLADPCIKLRRSPYRGVYELRRERTSLTHPNMLKEGGGCRFCDMAHEKNRKNNVKGWDCSAMVIDDKRGHHWTDGHSFADAKRVVAKAILKDLWLVENGLVPVVGSQPLLDADASTSSTNVALEAHTELEEEVEV